jgi:hypothetical protein
MENKRARTKIPAAKERLVEEVTVDNKAFQLVHADVPIGFIELDRRNPRIRYRLSLEATGKKPLEDVINAMPEVKALRKDIELNGGLRERIILQENGTKLKTIEGNCRMVALQSLHAKYPDDPRWKTVPARILPTNADPRQIAILLADFHVAGKIQWKAHEKAAHIYDMNNNLSMSQDEIASVLRTSKATVSRLLAAYMMMKDRFLTIDDSKYAKDGERKWSYFEEFYKSPEIRDELKRRPELADDFCRWVGDGRIPEGADVRRLTIILKHPDARDKFEKWTPTKEAFDKAMKVVESNDPEFGSEFFKLLSKMRESCTSAAQVKEILRIRADKNARHRVLETYTALVDFMRLADVEIPEPQ